MRPEGRGLLARVEHEVGDRDGDARQRETQQAEEDEARAMEQQLRQRDVAGQEGVADRKLRGEQRRDPEHEGEQPVRPLAPRNQRHIAAERRQPRGVGNRAQQAERVGAEEADEAPRAPQARQREQPPALQPRRVGPFRDRRGDEADQRRAEGAEDHLVRMPQAGRSGTGERQVEAENQHPLQRPDRGVERAEREEDAKTLVAEDVAQGRRR